MNKKAVYAGNFYPEDPDDLNSLLDSYKEPLSSD